MNTIQASSTQSIDAAKQLRQQLRTWLREQQFAALDQCLEEKNAAWLAGDMSWDRGYNWMCGFDTLFDPLLTRTMEDKLTLLRKWIAACPRSYHAHALMGELWTGVGAEIRGSGWASSVSEDRWVGARLARDLACIYLLKAIALHDKPSFACRSLMQVASYLQEPDWLVELFRGEIPLPYSIPSDPEERAIWEAGVQHLAEYGGELMSFPQQLPQGLPPREAHEFAEGRLYWLQRLMQYNPRDVESLRIAVYYLYPRWYGDHEQMAAFIDGPLCAALSEEERGNLWRMKEQDLLECYPEREDVDEINAQCRRWEALLARPMPPRIRHMQLGKYAKFLSHADRVPESYRRFAEAVELEIVQQVSDCFDEDELRNLAYDVIEGGLDDSRYVFYRLVMKGVVWGDDPWHLMIAAAGHQFGLWGFPRQPENNEAWLARAADLIDADEGSYWSGYNTARRLWKGKHPEAAEWLASQLALYGEAQGMLFLSDIYRNALYPDTAPEKCDVKLAEEWQRRAVATGDRQAKLGLAKYYLLADGYAVSDPQKFEEAYQLLKEVLDSGEDAARLPLFCLLVDSGSAEQQTWAHDTLAPDLLAEDDEDTQASVAVNLAEVYEFGKGAFMSSRLAAAWARRALELRPDDTYARYLLKSARNFGFWGLMNRVVDIIEKNKLRELLESGKVFAPEGFRL